MRGNVQTPHALAYFAQSTVDFARTVLSHASGHVISCFGNTPHALAYRNNRGFSAVLLMSKPLMLSHKGYFFAKPHMLSHILAMRP